MDVRIGEMYWRARAWMAVLALTIAAATSGCTIAPKRFSDVIDPAPLMRARAAGMGDQLPPQVVVPALIDRLNDEDPVVRLTAHEELKKRTNKDFGYQPWADPTARDESIRRWKAWWNSVARGSSATPPVATTTARRATSRPRTAPSGVIQVRHTMPMPRLSPNQG